MCVGKLKIPQNAHHGVESLGNAASKSKRSQLRRRVFMQFVLRSKKLRHLRPDIHVRSVLGQCGEITARDKTFCLHLLQHPRDGV